MRGGRRDPRTLARLRFDEPRKRRRDGADLQHRCRKHATPSSPLGIVLLVRSRRLTAPPGVADSCRPRSASARSRSLYEAYLVTAAADLTDKIAIRYRYRPHKLRAITKHAQAHRGRFVAHLKIPHAARRTRKGTLTVSYPGDAIHDPAKVNQRIKLHRG